MSDDPLHEWRSKTETELAQCLNYYRLAHEEELTAARTKHGFLRAALIARMRSMGVIADPSEILQTYEQGEAILKRMREEKLWREVNKLRAATPAFEALRNDLAGFVLRAKGLKKAEAGSQLGSLLLRVDNYATSAATVLNAFKNFGEVATPTDDGDDDPSGGGAGGGGSAGGASGGASGAASSGGAGSCGGTSMKSGGAQSASATSDKPGSKLAQKAAQTRRARAQRPVAKGAPQPSPALASSFEFEPIIEVGPRAIEASMEGAAQAVRELYSDDELIEIDATTPGAAVEDDDETKISPEDAAADARAIEDAISADMMSEAIEKVIAERVVAEPASSIEPAAQEARSIEDAEDAVILEEAAGAKEAATTPSADAPPAQAVQPAHDEASARQEREARIAEAVASAERALSEGREEPVAASIAERARPVDDFDRPEPPLTSAEAIARQVGAEKETPLAFDDNSLDGVSFEDPPAKQEESPEPSLAENEAEALAAEMESDGFLKAAHDRPWSHEIRLKEPVAAKLAPTDAKAPERHNEITAPQIAPPRLSFLEMVAEAERRAETEPPDPDQLALDVAFGKIPSQAPAPTKAAVEVEAPEDAGQHEISARSDEHGPSNGAPAVSVLTPEAPEDVEPAPAAEDVEAEELAKPAIEAALEISSEAVQEGAAAVNGALSTPSVARLSQPEAPQAYPAPVQMSEPASDESAVKPPAQEAALVITPPSAKQAAPADDPERIEEENSLLEAALSLVKEEPKLKTEEAKPPSSAQDVKEPHGAGVEAKDDVQPSPLTEPSPAEKPAPEPSPKPAAEVEKPQETPKAPAIAKLPPLAAPPPIQAQPARPAKAVFAQGSPSFSSPGFAGAVNGVMSIGRRKQVAQIPTGFIGYELREGDDESQGVVAGVKTWVGGAKPVSDLQRHLEIVGCYTGAVDGVFGAQTVLAVRRFQWNLVHVEKRYCASEKLLEPRVLEKGVAVSGVADPPTTRALKDWVSYGCETTGALQIVSVGSFDNFAQDVKLAAVAQTGAGPQDLVVSRWMVECLSGINAALTGQDASIRILSGFDVDARAQTAGLPSLEARTQQLIGNAIETEMLSGGETLDPIDLRRMARDDTMPAGVMGFLQALRAAPPSPAGAKVRWGGLAGGAHVGRFEIEVPPDGEDYAMCHYFNQRAIALKHVIERAEAA